MAVYDFEHDADLFKGPGLYLFRGCRPSSSYPSPYAGIGVTPTTIDPLIATLFAARYRAEGEAIVLISERSKFTARLDGPSLSSMAMLELSVNLEVTPVEFEDKAIKKLPIDTALMILGSMGLDLPVRLPDFEALNRALKDSDRLTTAQIDHFCREALSLKQ